MAFNLVTAPTGGVPLSTNDYDAQNQILQALLYNLMQKTKHLTEWDTLVEPEMAKNVYVQHGGALFLGDSDTAIAGAGALADGRVYIKVDRAGDALTFTFVNSAAGYEWNDAYCGFYHADNTQLLPYVLYKTAAGYYKFDLKESEDKFDITAYIHYKIKKEVGVWDMDVSNFKDFAFDDILTQLETDLTIDEFAERIYNFYCSIIHDAKTYITDFAAGEGYMDLLFASSEMRLVFDSYFGGASWNDNTMNRGYYHYSLLL